MERREWWQVEELVPAENAIGGVAYWTKVLRYMAGKKADAEDGLRHLRAAGRTVRLVRCTEEVVPVEG